MHDAAASFAATSMARCTALVSSVRPILDGRQHDSDPNGERAPANVEAINSEAGSQWLAEITEFNQYGSLVEWATLSVVLADCWTFRENSISTGFTHGVEMPL